jgi:hypothetical protein
LKRKRSDESLEVAGSRASDQKQQGLAEACRDDKILRLPKQNGELATFLYTDGGRLRRGGFKFRRLSIGFHDGSHRFGKIRGMTSRGMRAAVNQIAAVFGARKKRQPVNSPTSHRY